MRRTHLIRVAVFLFALTIFAGCGGQPVRLPTGDEKAPKKDGTPDKHSHAAPHGGTVVDLGGGKYHAELLVDRDRTEATVYLLDGDAKNAFPVNADTILLSIKDPQFQVELKAVPLDGEPKGMSSRFVRTHEKLGKGQDLAGTISGEIDGKPYAGDFKLDKNGPAAQAESREAKLFLTPGGIYTKADIDKNGNTVPSVKFKGISWAHDDNLKVGDKVCPITDNKADPQCFWWVNGEKYEFCCPPCLDKFVKWAKETPEKVKAPGAYVKK